MTKTFFNVCDKYRKFRNPKTLYMNEYKKTFKEEDSMEKIFFIEEINQSELVGKSIRSFVEFWIKLNTYLF